MDWNIGDAKQHLSEVVRLAADEPQVLKNRDKPVAVVIAADQFDDYLAWRARAEQPVARALRELDAIVADDDGVDGLPIPPRVDRDNPLLAPEAPAEAPPVPRRHQRRH
jgi:prevent-host-death family protein